MRDRKKEGKAENFETFELLLVLLSLLVPYLHMDHDDAFSSSFSDDDELQSPAFASS